MGVPFRNPMFLWEARGWREPREFTRSRGFFDRWLEAVGAVHFATPGSVRSRWSFRRRLETAAPWGFVIFLAGTALGAESGTSALPCSRDVAA